MRKIGLKSQCICNGLSIDYYKFKIEVDLLLCCTYTWPLMTVNNVQRHTRTVTQTPSPLVMLSIWEKWVRCERRKKFKGDITYVTYMQTRPPLFMKVLRPVAVIITVSEYQVLNCFDRHTLLFFSCTYAFHTNSLLLLHLAFLFFFLLMGITYSV